MPSPLLTVLKYVFLAVLYLFFLRVLRAVWVELREPRIVTRDGPEASPFARVFSRPPTPVAVGGTGAEITVASDAESLTSAVSPVPSGAAPDYLVVTGPPERLGVTYPLAGEVTVGRAPGCGISLPDDTFVSQLHARVFHRDGAWWVEDLGSTNGTFVNNAQVGAPVVVRRGDHVQFGQTVMELRP